MSFFIAKALVAGFARAQQRSLPIGGGAHCASAHDLAAAGRALFSRGSHTC